MGPTQDLESQIQECLTRLGISSAVDWDVLAFVYRHQASLANAEQISRMLGYPGIAVADALDHLEYLKLIQRSRASRGVRLYQFRSSAEDDPSGKCFRALTTLATTPAGRLMLLNKLRQYRAGLSLAKKKGADV